MALQDLILSAVMTERTSALHHGALLALQQEAIRIWGVRATLVLRQDIELVRPPPAIRLLRVRMVDTLKANNDQYLALCSALADAVTLTPTYQHSRDDERRGIVV